MAEQTNGNPITANRDALDATAQAFLSEMENSNTVQANDKQPKQPATEVEPETSEQQANQEIDDGLEFLNEESDTEEDFQLICTDGGIYISYDQFENVQNLSMNGLGVSQYYSTYTTRFSPYHIYAGSQMGTMLPYLFAQFLQMKPEDIIYHPHLIGGGFGKRYEIEHIIMASMASIQLKKPVKLIFTREDAR